MAQDTILSIICVFLSALLIFLMIYFIITLTDLECDYLNSMQCCKRLNKCLLPEIVVAAIVPLVIVFSKYWFLSIIAAICPCYLLWKYLTVPKGNLSVYDPTDIYNRGELRNTIKITIAKLGYHLVFFFVFLYWFKTRVARFIQSKAGEFNHNSKKEFITNIINFSPIFN
ncbi:protein cornichon homolog 4-like isoform X2 [Gordionus sp. m RMFG-2023]|uniref:protein cornichon homolog 4-like isoform X2 n=1 Tax=Gordionus sp. m RMFG-2023 TaxID=3053472 RepID=UPI0031FBBB5B